VSIRDVAQSVDAHYSKGNLSDRILNALRSAGLDSGSLKVEDLSPLDQFHSGGKKATLDLARLAAPLAGERVLEVGGGIGGPARTLAHEYGCNVTVLDLTEEYCQVGETLTRLTGLSNEVAFKQGNALDLPFKDGEFDLVWTQHSSMNIQDKPRLYGEIHRVTRPGGRLAFQEIMAGPNQPVQYPVPWAADESISFLITPDETRTLLKSLGFVERTWVDFTPEAIVFFNTMAEKLAAEGPPPLGVHVIVGPTWMERSRSLIQNYEQNRTVVIQAVLDRP
jgi:MPBQ/MSBQ methyltransferase